MSPRQYLIVARHGLRQDELDSRWVQQAQRPWDPPLAESGTTQVKSRFWESLSLCGVNNLPQNYTAVNQNKSSRCILSS